MNGVGGFVGISVLTTEEFTIANVRSHNKPGGEIVWWRLMAAVLLTVKRIIGFVFAVPTAHINRL